MHCSAGDLHGQPEWRSVLKSEGLSVGFPGAVVEWPLQHSGAPNR